MSDFMSFTNHLRDFLLCQEKLNEFQWF